RAEPLVGDGVVAVAGGCRGGQRLAFLGGARDQRRRYRRRGIDHRGRRQAGRRRGEVLLVGRGGDHLEGRAFVGFLDQVGRAGADRGGVVVGRAEPLVGDGVVAVTRRGRGGQRLAFLGSAADYGSAHRRRGVDHRGGRQAGPGHRQTLFVGRRGDHLEGRAFVGLLDQVGRAGADRGGVVVGRAEPLVGDGVVAVAGGCRGGQRLAFLGGAADYGSAHRRRGVDHRGRRQAGPGH